MLLTRAIATAGVAAVALALALPAYSVCEDQIPDAQRRVPATWLKNGSNFSHPNGAGMNFQCNDGEPLTAYVQIPVEGADLPASYEIMADLGRRLMGKEVSFLDVETCILKVRKSRPTDEGDTWRGVRRFGPAFECGKDQDSHFYRIHPAVE